MKTMNVLTPMVGDEALIVDGPSKGKAGTVVAIRLQDGDYRFEIEFAGGDRAEFPSMFVERAENWLKQQMERILKRINQVYEGQQARIDQVELGGMLNVLYGMTTTAWSISSGYVRIAKEEHKAEKMREIANRAEIELKKMIDLISKEIDGKGDRS